MLTYRPQKGWLTVIVFQMWNSINKMSKSECGSLMVTSAKRGKGSKKKTPTKSFNSYTKLHFGARWDVSPLIPTLGRQRQVNLCKFESTHKAVPKCAE